MNIVYVYPEDDPLDGVFLQCKEQGRVIKDIEGYLKSLYPDADIDGYIKYYDNACKFLVCERGFDWEAEVYYCAVLMHEDSNVVSG